MKLFMVLLAAIALGLAATSPVFADGDPAREGSVVPAGTLAITEIDDWSTGISVIFGGYIPVDFRVCDRCTPQTSAWLNYSSLQRAQSDACIQADRRRADPVFAGFVFTVTSGCGGQATPPAPVQAPQVQVTTAPVGTTGYSATNLPVFTNHGPKAPCGGAGVTPVQPGTTVSAGSFGILRLVHWDSMTAYVIEFNATTGPAPVDLSIGSAYDGDPLHSAAFWWNCKSGRPWGWMQIDSCGESVEILRGGLGSRGWLVYRNGHPLPQEDCIDP